MSAMQDPKVAGLLQQNPMAPQIQAAMLAHINEHLGFAYRVEIEKQLGFNLPPQKDESGEDIHMNPEVEARLAPLLAQAAQQLLQQNQAEAAQAQAQAQAQDPMVQMQQMELQIKAEEVKRKAAKDQGDLALKEQELQADTMLKAEELKLRRQQLVVDTMAHGAKLDTDQRKMKADATMQAFTHMTDMKFKNDQQKKQLAMELLRHEDDLEKAKEERASRDKTK